MKHSAGMTLLETLVGLALGLVVVGAVAAHYLFGGQSARLQAAQAQMSDDAQIALQLLTTDVMMAGYALPKTAARSTDAALSWTLPLDKPALVACDFGFVSASTTGEVQCAATGSSAALAVHYQADAFNTVPLSGSATPSDCLGNGLDLKDGVYLTENRWFVASSNARTELRCASRLGNPGQPLVDNVESLALWLGQAQASDPVRPVRYVSASQVGDWRLVRSVRLCLLMRSTDAVLSAADEGAYRDCQGRRQASSDRQLRRAFHATVALRHGSGR